MRAAHDFHYGIDLGIIENSIKIVDHLIGKGRGWKISEIKNVFDIDIVSAKLRNLVFIIGDQLRNSRAYNTEAEYSNVRHFYCPFILKKIIIYFTIYVKKIQYANLLFS